MSDTTLHTLYAPLAVAISRMPGAVRAGSAEVVLERQGAAPLWRWRGSRDTGTVSLAALSPTQTRLAVTAEGASALPTADALTVALYGALERQWESPTAAMGGLVLGRRTKLVLVTAALLIPLLAITGMRLVAPPKAMDVASAVSQFREQSQQSAAGAGGGGGHTADRAAAKTGVRPARKEARAARPAANRNVAATQTAAPARPRQRAAQRDPSAARNPRPQRQATAAPAPERRQPSQSRKQPAGAHAPARRQAAATSPEEGVYRYATDGYESIDRPSSRHDYPSETALSIRATDCGFDARWQPLENRWDQMSVCRRDGVSLLPRLSTHREFYGQSNDSNYTCGRTNYAYLPKPGSTWTGTCADGDAKMQIRGRTIAREPVRVGNETVETVHYALEARISGGDAEGMWTAERWVDPDTGLLIRVEAQTRATSQSSVGTVNYREELSLMLISTTPQR